MDKLLVEMAKNSVILTQKRQQYKEIYGEIKELEESNKRIWGMIKEKISNSNGKLTISKLYGEEE